MFADKTIRVPTPLWHAIKLLSKKRNIPMWVLIQDMYNYWYSQYREYHDSMPNIDKAAWYATKLGMSVGILKAKPNDTNLQWTLKTCKQIRNRLGIDTNLLQGAATNYAKTPSKKTVMALNQALKLTIIEIIAHYISEIEVTPP